MADLLEIVDAGLRYSFEQQEVLENGETLAEEREIHFVEDVIIMVSQMAAPVNFSLKGALRAFRKAFEAHDEGLAVVDWVLALSADDDYAAGFLSTATLL